MWSETKTLRNSMPAFLRIATVALAIVALTGSLATRTFRATVCQDSCVQSAVSQAMRQHLDRDAAAWSAPVVYYSVVDAPTFYPRVAPAGPPVRAQFLEQKLYNRPPPSC